MILLRGLSSRTVLAGVEVGGELGLGVGGEAAPGRLVAEGRGSRGGVAVAATRHRADRGHGVEGGQGGGGGGGGGGDRAREVEGEPRHGEAAVRH